MKTALFLLFLLLLPGKILVTTEDDLVNVRTLQTADDGLYIVLYYEQDGVFSQSLIYTSEGKYFAKAYVQDSIWIFEQRDGKQIKGLKYKRGDLPY